MGEIIANKSLRGADVAKALRGPFAGHTFRNTTFQDYTGPSLLHGKLGKGIVFENCLFRRLKTTGTILFFPGSTIETRLDNYGLEFVNCAVQDCEASDLFEFKAGWITLTNLRVARCGAAGVRLRHSTRNRLVNCTGIPRIKVRGDSHEVVNCPQSAVVLYAGNLNGKLSEQAKGHQAGEGHNMQSAFRCKVTNVKSVALGFHFGDNDQKYPATECVLSPELRGRTQVIREKGTRWEEVAA